MSQTLTPPVEPRASPGEVHGLGGNISAAPRGWHWCPTTTGTGSPLVPTTATAAPWGPGSPTAEGRAARSELVRRSVWGESRGVGAKFGMQHQGYMGESPWMGQNLGCSIEDTWVSLHGWTKSGMQHQGCVGESPWM